MSTVVCPACEHEAAFSEFTRAGACPDCETSLQTLLDAEVGL